MKDTRFQNVIGTILEKVLTTDKKQTLEDKVRMVCNQKLPSKYNLPQFKNEKAIFNCHKDVCKQLVELSDELNVPICFLIYFSVGKDAHKSSSFNNGYRNIDTDKARAIVAMAQAYCTHNGFKKPTDKIYHAITKYYDKVSSDVEAFNKIITKMNPTKDNDFKMMVNLFGCPKYHD